MAFSRTLVNIVFPVKTLSGTEDVDRLQIANFQDGISIKVIYNRGKMPENFQVPTCQRPPDLTALIEHTGGIANIHVSFTPVICYKSLFPCNN